MSDINTIKKLKNAEGKRMLEKLRLEYSKEIIQELLNDQTYFPELLNDIEETENNFLSYVSGDNPANITFYHETLVLLKQRKK